MKTRRILISGLIGAAVAVLLPALLNCGSSGLPQKRIAEENGPDTVSQLNFCFSPPAGWKMIDSTGCDSLEKSIARHFNGVTYDICAAYHSAEGCGCTITSICPRNSTDDFFSDSSFAVYRDSLLARLTKLGKVNVKTFDLGGYSVQHARVNTAETVVFTLLFQENDRRRVFQLDYLVPSQYADSVTVSGIAMSAVSVRPLQRTSSRPGRSGKV